MNFLGKDLGPECGKKAYRLHLLKQAGFPVPAGFVLREFLNSDLPQLSQLSLAIEQIGGYPVAVRSSGAMEDLNDASFAGLYESFLFVQDLDELVQRINQCFASVKSERVQSYLLKKNISAENNSLSVLVQKMVPAEMAGVTFGIHPVTGKEEDCLVEVCKGVGEKLVSGHITPTQYILNYPQVSNGDFFSAEQLVKHCQIGSEQAQLSRPQLRELIQQTTAIQKYFKHPQDIEWAIDQQGKFWVLQARDITKIKWRTDLGEFTNADFKDGGVSSRVCTPMMYSLYQGVFKLSLPFYLYQVGLLKNPHHGQSWIHRVYGRVYWNAGIVKNCVVKLPGFDEQKFDQDLGIQREYPAGGGIKTPLNLESLLFAVPILYKMYAEFDRCLKKLYLFYTKFEQQDLYFKNLLGRQLANMSDDKFAEVFHQLIHEYYMPTETLYFRTIYNNSNYQTEFKGLIARLEKKLNINISILSLMSGLDNVSHMEVQKGICKLYSAGVNHGIESADFATSLGHFIQKHYHHGDGELILNLPRWGEKPEMVKAMIASMLKSKLVPHDPESAIETQKQQFKQEVAKITSALKQSWSARIFRTHQLFHKKLTTLRHFLLQREKMRECSTRAYYLVRLYLLECEKRLASMKLGATGIRPDIQAKGGIFFYQMGEILEFLYNRQGLPSTEEISARRNYYEMFENFKAPNEFGHFGQYDNLNSGAARNSVQVNEEEDAYVIKGLACSSGKVLGRAKVILNMNDFHLLEKGDILITKFTDPGWTPILGLVAGIVTEVGGILSHAAVIGREYGIPAVLNIEGVTNIIHSEDLIEVDGEAGVVKIFKKAQTK